MINPHAIITDYHIDLYSRCPRRCFFEWEKPQKDPENLLRRVIQKCYSFLTKNGYFPPWKRVFNWASDEITAIITSRPDSYYDEYKGLLAQLQYWYYDHFSQEPEAVGIPNVPLKLDLTKGQLSLTADLLIWNPEPTLVQIVQTHRPTSERILFEKPSIYAKLWLLRETLSVKTNRCRIIYTFPQSVRVKDKILTDDQLRRGASSTDLILKGIQSDTFYPSITEQCDNCPHKYKCRF